MTLGGEMFKKVILGLILCFVPVSYAPVFSAGGKSRELDFVESHTRGYYAMERLKRFDEAKEYTEKRRDELEKKLAKLRKKKGTSEKVIQNLEKQLLQTEQTLDNLFTPGNDLGRIVAIGIANQDLGDSNIDGIGDGIWKGILANTSKALGEVVSDKAKGTIEHVLGGTWDFTVDSLVSGFNEINLSVFHNGKKPFSEQLINGWFELASGTLRDIEQILKDYLKESSRGHDKTLRQFDGGEQKVEEVANGWRDLIAGHVEVFDDIINDIEQRKEYYGDENDPIVRFANQIQKRLLKFRHLLAAAKTIKDLDAALDSNRSIVDALRSDLDRLFKHLTDLVTPKTYSMSSRNAQTSRGDGHANARSKHARSRYGSRDRDDEDFPGSLR